MCNNFPFSTHNYVALPRYLHQITRPTVKARLACCLSRPSTASANFIRNKRQGKRTDATCTTAWSTPTSYCSSFVVDKKATPPNFRAFFQVTLITTSNSNKQLRILPSLTIGDRRFSCSSVQQLCEPTDSHGRPLIFSLVITAEKFR